MQKCKLRRKKRSNGKTFENYAFKSFLNCEEFVLGLKLGRREAGKRKSGVMAVKMAIVPFRNLPGVPSFQLQAQKQIRVR